MQMLQLEFGYSRTHYRIVMTLAEERKPFNRESSMAFGLAQQLRIGSR